MNYSTTSDASTIPVLCEQRMELHFDELNQKLNDLIYKEQVNQLWKLGVENTLHSIWSRVCYQRVCVSTSSQTDELFEEDRHNSLESAIGFNETSRTLLEEENELNHEELHNVIEVNPFNSSSTYENEISASLASPEQPIKFGDANCCNLADQIRFCSDRQKETVHLNETSRTTQGHNNSFASNVEEKSELNGEEQQDVVEVVHSSSSSIHEDKMTLSDASPEQPTQRTTKSRSKRVKLYPSKFSRKVETSQHERTREKSSFKCDNCLQVFANQSGFTVHRRFCSYQPNESGSFVCAECGKSYSMRKKFIFHLRYHSKKKQRSGLAVIAPSHVKVRKVAHVSAKQFRCKLCSKRYTAMSSLRHHIRKHHVKQQENS